MFVCPSVWFDLHSFHGFYHPCFKWFSIWLISDSIFDMTFTQGGKWHYTLNFTGTQSFITTLSHLLAKKHWVSLLGDFVGWFQISSVQTFQPIALIYRKGNFVNQHWVCILIYHTLYYPCIFRITTQRPIQRPITYFFYFEDFFGLMIF